jgi:hypothetical protein
MTTSKRKSNAKKQAPVVLEQFVEVSVRKGITITELYPPTEEMLAEFAKMDPPPDLIYRRYNFRGCVPPEYRWATLDPTDWKYGGGALQRMQPSAWLAMVEEEKRTATGHLVACYEIMPRPEETGGCDCPVCTAAQARLDSLKEAG